MCLIKVVISSEEVCSCRKPISNSIYILAYGGIHTSLLYYL